jgi:DNA-binding XRE family transcriptional regulator
MPENNKFFVVECETVEESIFAQKNLFRRGFQWFVGGHKAAAITAFKVRNEEKMLDMFGYGIAKTPQGHALENDVHFFFLPRERTQFLQHIGVLGKTMTIGEQIAMVRRARKIKQEDLADQVGISKTHLNRIENDEKTNPTLNVLKRIAEVLNGRITFTV